MKKLIYVFIALTLMSCKSSKFEEFSPTGTYKLGNYNIDSNEKAEEYFGEIQVKQISSDKILMTFMINKGAPSYNSGSFIDTLKIENKYAVYKTPEFDKSCKVTFAFEEGGVKVDEETDDFNSGCGFGHAVVAKGYFRKVSSNVPVLRNPMTNEQI